MVEKSTERSQSLAGAIAAAGLSIAAMIGTYNVTARGVTETVPDVRTAERISDSEREGEIIAKAGESPVKEGVFELWWYARKSQCRARTGTADFETGIAEADCSGSLIVRDGEAYRRAPTER